MEAISHTRMGQSEQGQGGPPHSGFTWPMTARPMSPTSDWAVGEAMLLGIKGEKMGR